MVSISCILKSYVTYSLVVHLRVIEGQKTEKGIFHIKEKIKNDPRTQFRVDEKGVLWFQHRLVVLKNRELKNRIMVEAHLSKLSIHPGRSKMYQDIRSHFWWTKMKKEIAGYVARCDTCCSQGYTYETYRSVTTVVSSRLEMGRGQHGLYHRLTDNTKGK